MNRSFTVVGFALAGAAGSAVIALAIYLFLVFVPGPGFKSIDDAATDKERTCEMVASPVALFVFLAGSIGSLAFAINVTGKSQNENGA